MPKRAAADDGASRKKSGASAAADTMTQDSESVQRARAANVEAGRRGHVICTKIAGLFGVPEQREGYVTVLPNYKHANSQRGRGLARLSPKSLGPVLHGQPGQLPATCIENIWQGSKEFAFELNDDGTPTAEGAAKRAEMYADPVPRRHKYDAATLRAKSGLRARDPVPRPRWTRYVRDDGTNACFDYVQSRYLYCHWMETLAKREQQWTTLEQLVADGYNVNISGYDGYTSDAPLDEQYVDTARPFGHEKVLEAMLSIAEPADYPWNRYYRANAELYAGLTCAHLT